MDRISGVGCGGSTLAILSSWVWHRCCNTPGYLPDPHWESAMSPASATFYAAMEKTGFVTDLIVFTWLVSGVALPLSRRRPLELFGFPTQTFAPAMTVRSFTS